MRRALKDQLAEVGFAFESYRVGYPGEPDLPRISGVAVLYHGREIGVVEQIPRGWGGDDKWRVRAARSLPDADGPALSIHRTQREAFAAAIRTFV